MGVEPLDDEVIVSVHDLTYYYPDIEAPALSGVELEVQRGEFVLLVGPSGSGKSTLLRALNGLVPKYHGGRYGGRVEVDGLRAGSGPTAELAQKVGLVFQDPERQAVMSRVDNEVAFGLECLGVPSDAITGRVEAALGAVGLADRAEDLVSELSSGQAQRLALASVLAMEPEVLALDEPTSQLDPETAEEFFGYLEGERSRRGATVLLAEHRLEKGLKLADRVVVVEDGKVVFDGTPRDFVTTRCGGEDGVGLTSLGEVFRGQGDPPMDLDGARQRFERLYREDRLSVHRRKGPEPGATAVLCEGVRFAYETGQDVLTGVDLDLRSGEVLVLVGPNGSGKTTLARHFNGLLRPQDGRVLVGGEDAARRSVSQLTRRVALLTQNPGDYLFERTVEGELRLTASYRGLEGKGAEEAIQEIVLELGLAPFLDRFSWDLSAGQRQRVALGALMVGAPDVLILDEPTRGMDTAHKASLASLARRQAEAGRAGLLITHDMECAARAADRYAVLEEGRVVASGSAERVFEARPAYAPILWKATEGLAIPPDQRPLSPADIEVDGNGRGGGGAW